MANPRPEPDGDGTIEAMSSSVPTDDRLGGIDRERVAAGRDAAGAKEF